MSIYEDLQKVSADVLTQFDQKNIQLLQFSQGEGGTPDEPAENVEVVHDLRGVAKGVSFKYLKDNFITSSDVEVTTNVLNGVQPSLNDFIVMDEIRYKVLQFEQIPAAGTACVWKFIVRKGG